MSDVTFLKFWLSKYRLVLILSVHFISTSIGYFLALGLRFDFDPTEVFLIYRTYLPLALLFFFRHGTYVFWRLNRGYWRYTSTQDLVLLLKAHILSSVLFTASLLLLRVPDFPRSVIIIELALSLIISGGLRFAVRLIGEQFFFHFNMRHSLSASSVKEVIVIGAGDSGHFMVKNLLTQKRLGYKPVAVLDDSPRMLMASVYGVQVVGKLNDLEAVLDRFPRVASVILAIPSLSSKRVEGIENSCRKLGVPLKRLQAFEDIAYQDVAEPLSLMSIETTLEREVDVQHEDEIRSVLKGRRILVTGGGGSIGSELVRQLMPFEPASLSLLDCSEYNLYRMDLELKKASGRIKTQAILGSICDRARMRNVFKELQPEFIFHAAAYKHVPLMESNCYEAFKNNIVGTETLLELSLEFGVNRFVLISSDKAVNPSSVMGCSKRVAELLVNQFGHIRTNGSHKLNTAVVRFGNVINSAGSVIPLFKEQILSGGPLTVTHPEMERYFMSIREAVRLVLTAGVLGDAGEIFMLDMGKPIKIVDVAKKMLALYGRRDIEIVITGVRPGEKITEELNNHYEKWHKTRFAKVFRVEDLLATESDIRQNIAQLGDKITQLNENQVSHALFQLLAHSQSQSLSPQISRRDVA